MEIYKTSIASIVILLSGIGFGCAADPEAGVPIEPTIPAEPYNPTDPFRYV